MKQMAFAALLLVSTEFKRQSECLVSKFLKPNNYDYNYDLLK